MTKEELETGDIYHIMLSSIGEEHILSKGVELTTNKISLPGNDRSPKGCTLYVFVNRDKFHQAIDLLIDNRIHPIKIDFDFKK